MCLSVMITEYGWENWMLVLVNTCMIICWVIFVGNYQQYEFRAKFTSTMMFISMGVYMFHPDKIQSSFATFATLLVVLGLYGSEAVIRNAIIFFTIVFFWHLFVTRAIRMMFTLDDTTDLLQIFALYLAEFVVFYLVRTQNRAKKQMLKTIEGLRVTEQSKDDFMANVSHEIRTPINTICGMSEVILREELPKQVRSELFGIQTAGRNLLSVVSDILDFSELQSGKMELIEVSYNITSTINDIVNMLMAKRNERRIIFNIVLDPTIPARLLGDEQKIRRIILNLLDNALKFTNEGVVFLNVKTRKESYGVNLHVTVSDTGIGMNKESMDKLFTSFNQVDTRRNRQEGGIGLGLSISHAMVQKMGGFIKVESELGKGSVFQFVVPQRVVDDTPIVYVKDARKISILCYINIEMFKSPVMREKHLTNMAKMYESLSVKAQICRTLGECKRRQKKEYYSHVIISFTEYIEDVAFFDSLSEQMPVAVIIEQTQERMITNSNLVLIPKPFFVLPLANFLNGEKIEYASYENHYATGKFTAPEANVLIVDDNEMNVKVAQGLLKPYKMNIYTAFSGKEALRKVEEYDFDLIFMDHMMPEMDGVETMHHIREKAGYVYQNLPIVALTANAINGAREMFLKEGFDDFISKPIELSALERVLRDYIPKRKKIFGESKKRHQVKAEETIMKDEIVRNVSKNRFDLGDIDTSMGITYCGTEENYIEVLQMHARDGRNNLEKIEQLFQTEDWKNYTILVHALKSSMKSIGAESLSELAKGLEMAGKQNDVGYIKEHHQEMLVEYERVIDILNHSSVVGENVPQISESGFGEENVNMSGTNRTTQNADEIDMDSLHQLDEKEVQELFQTLESAIFTFREEEILKVIEVFEQSQYHGHAFVKHMDIVRKKIEMSDYMSAFEHLTRLVKKWKG